GNPKIPVPIPVVHLLDATLVGGSHGVWVAKRHQKPRVRKQPAKLWIHRERARNLIADDLDSGVFGPQTIIFVREDIERSVPCVSLANLEKSVRGKFGGGQFPAKSEQIEALEANGDLRVRVDRVEEQTRPASGATGDEQASSTHQRTRSANR